MPEQRRDLVERGLGAGTDERELARLDHLGVARNRRGQHLGAVSGQESRATRPSLRAKSRSIRPGCAAPDLLPCLDLDSRPSGPAMTSFTSSRVETMQNTMSQPASSVRWLAIFAPSFASGSALARVRFHTVMSQPAFASRCAISNPMRPAPIQPSFSFSWSSKKFLVADVERPAAHPRRVIRPVELEASSRAGRPQYGLAIGSSSAGYSEMICGPFGRRGSPPPRCAPPRRRRSPGSRSPPRTPCRP